MKQWMGRVLIVTPLLILFTLSVMSMTVEILILWGLTILFLGMIFGGMALLDDA